VPHAVVGVREKLALWWFENMTVSALPVAVAQVEPIDLAKRLSQHRSSERRFVLKAQPECVRLRGAKAHDLMQSPRQSIRRSPRRAAPSSFSWC
jgi:hypothetical protein